MSRRGYSIVEAAIVLAAFLLLVGGMAWPFAQSIRSDQDASERAYMESMKEAVVAYAMRNRTPGGSMEIEFTAVTLNVGIPSGRPYLPCPDTDGDGLENRVNRKVSGLVTVTASDAKPYGVTIRDNHFGMCTSWRGMFPWRTLGTKPADQWGNHYDYYVHTMLASPLLGFDETSGRYLNLVAVSGEGEECELGDWLPTGTGYDNLGVSTQGALGYMGLDNFLDYPSIIVGRMHDAPAGTRILEAAASGQAFDASFLQDRRRLANGSGDQVEVLRHCWSSYYVAADIQMRRAYEGGVAFAIVSHGRNGYGAVRHDPAQAHLHRAITSADCYAFPGSGDAFASEIANGSCLPSTLSNPNSGRFHLLLHSTTTTGGWDVYFDDLVAWMMPQQLFGELAQVGALPRPPAIKMVEF